VLCDVNIREFFTFYHQKPSIATMMVIPSINNHDYSLVLFDKEYNLVGFLGKDETIPNDVYPGIFNGYQILSPGARSYLKPVPQSIIRNLLSVNFIRRL
jgi:hypothetical protein